ncbi:MAG: hypothetical protein UY31_C0023G0010 [Candidatus Wolfebacteria bacterium GW2011_GWE1_48_7]|nr:MAG: hypothetical protein UX58_C0003G0078 [Candidatus Wolfebacteria bacterium GW2011_GWB2_46_69]KKU54070.1 MAG: hypothetical protein UX76_C0006G0036 [Candidatus Wolfebacteria bacterium GW2011_GWC1_47_103]KKU59257.1 MAG: hypothetical protein UX83_C0006G0027 [Candidatus Wolfebacteria bacterium GW2011_GWE2_47_12]KKU99602.1 MAG: hypothetical protein UY31_C0023G0010 [Candidatus Wolfebacteria bacterium GW2011_GWE1_48_7]
MVVCAYELVMDGPPLVRVELGECCISLKFTLHLCEVHPVSERECLCVDLRPSNDEYLGRGVHQMDALLKRFDKDAVAKHFGVRALAMLPRCDIAGDDHVTAVGKRLSVAGEYGLEGPTPHDDRLAGGECSESVQIARQMPGQTAFVANDAIAVHGEDDRNDHRELLVYRGLPRDGDLDVRMRIVPRKNEVVGGEAEDVGDVGIEGHARQRPRIAGKLLAHELDLVQIDVGVRNGMDELFCLEPGDLRQHHQKE